MTRFGRLFLDALRSPSSFEGQPLRYLANQSGHMLAVGALGALLLPWWLVLAAYAAWEAAQVWRYEAELWDAAEDIAFVTCGVLAASGLPAALAPAALFLAAGALRRRA